MNGGRLLVFEGLDGCGKSTQIARLAAALRAGRPPVVVRVAEDRLLVDLRTVAPEDEQTLLDALTAAARA